MRVRPRLMRTAGCRGRGRGGGRRDRRSGTGAAGPARWSQVYGMGGCAGVTPAAGADAPGSGCNRGATGDAARCGPAGQVPGRWPGPGGTRPAGGAAARRAFRDSIHDQYEEATTMPDEPTRPDHDPRPGPGHPGTDQAPAGQPTTDQSATVQDATVRGAGGWPSSWPTAASTPADGWPGGGRRLAAPLAARTTTGPRTTGPRTTMRRACRGRRLRAGPATVRAGGGH